MPALHVVSINECFPVNRNPVVVNLVNQFCYQCGLRHLPWMYTSFSQHLKRFSEELLLEAIARTARAPRPTYAYLVAILSNCEAAEAYDLAGMMLKTSPKQRRKLQEEYEMLLE